MPMQLVWDPLIRLYHLLLLLAVTAAWWLEDENLQLHLLFGAIVLGLIPFRLIWGVIGPRFSRFQSLPLKPRAILQHIRQLLRLQRNRHSGHTPLGSVMIVTLLLLLLLICISGLAVFSLQSGYGLMAAWAQQVDYQRERWLTEIHALLADGVALLAALHLAGVLIESRLSGVNLIMSMVHGKKEIEENAS